MNDDLTMRALAAILVHGRELVSEAGRSHLDDDAHIPNEIFKAFADAITDYDEIEEMDK